MDAFANAYELRLLVFIEKDDFSGFNQVMLDRNQFKKVSDDILTGTKKDPTLKDGYEMATFNANDEIFIPAEVFDGLNSINEKDDE